MNGDLERIYMTVCLAGDPRAALDRLGDATLAALAVHLDSTGITGGVPGMVAGLVELEIIKRWVAEHAGNISPVGEG